MFAYCNNNAVCYSDHEGKNFSYTCDYDEGYNFNGWLLEGCGVGGTNCGGSYFGLGTAYHNYAVYSNTAACDAYLGGYYYGGGGYVGGYTAQFVTGKVTVTDSMVAYNYTSRGSTGRTEPQNLLEKLAMEQVKANPLDNAKQISVSMTDPRWPATSGWVKMASNVNGVEIHFVHNKLTHYYDDFKFK